MATDMTDVEPAKPSSLEYGSTDLEPFNLPIIHLCAPLLLPMGENKGV